MINANGKLRRIIRCAVSHNSQQRENSNKRENNTLTLTHTQYTARLAELAVRLTGSKVSH